VTDFPAILELDVNPLVATPDGATAVDVRLTIDPDAVEGVDDATGDGERDGEPTDSTTTDADTTDR
jgi:succinyl-CoA synthetase beta subunit